MDVTEPVVRRELSSEALVAERPFGRVNASGGRAENNGNTIFADAFLQTGDLLFERPECFEQETGAAAVPVALLWGQRQKFARVAA
jgi:hypothetical protein